MSSVLGEPVWKNAPRHVPQLRLPPYRYLPGKNLHPDEAHLAPFPDNEAFLYGIDLYHAGYFYEAHEAWESLWMHLPKGNLQRTLLHGLIQLTAALLKLELGEAQPALRLSRRALHYIEAVSRSNPREMNLDLQQLQSQLQRYFQALWATGRPGPLMSISRAPRLQIL